tara:strand:+ start:173 stop:592 length:420 start_codon:yes stop_codon:yes gene_type:complete
MKKNRTLEHYPFHVTMETRWRDLDAFGHVNNAVFATYIENARATLFGRWNLPYLGKGQSLILASMKIDYLKQLKHPTKIIIGQRISRIGNSSFDVESSIFTEKNKISPIAISKIIVVCFDFDKQKPVRVFDQVIEDSKL